MNFSPYRNYWFYGLTLPAILVSIDQATKYWIIDMFDVPTNICEIDLYPRLFKEVSPIFDWALVCNPGISFGLLGGDSPAKRWGLTIFAVFMCCVLLYALARTKDNLTRFSIALIIGGAIGNGIDRFLYGAVTDFISVHQLIPFFPWVFNVADSCITIGVIGLLAASYINDRKPIN